MMPKPMALVQPSMIASPGKASHVSIIELIQTFYRGLARAGSRPQIQGDLVLAPTNWMLEFGTAGCLRFLSGCIFWFLMSADEGPSFSICWYRSKFCFHLVGEKQILGTSRTFSKILIQCPVEIWKSWIMVWAADMDIDPDDLKENLRMTLLVWM